MKSMIELNESLKQENEMLKDVIQEKSEYYDDLIERNQILYEKVQKSIEYIVKNMHCKNKYELLKILIGD